MTAIWTKKRKKKNKKQTEMFLTISFLCSSEKNSHLWVNYPAWLWFWQRKNISGNRIRTGKPRCFRSVHTVEMPRIMGLWH